jgi:hypothetical protein
MQGGMERTPVMGQLLLPAGADGIFLGKYRRISAGTAVNR